MQKYERWHANKVYIERENFNLDAKKWYYKGIMD